ncbi:conserved Plasmodium protein, unknown function [Plasmodium berghei]|uniref:Uncharacterized protein n=2 Tax=Plasmodium berghei TaxID=5821 RepID=A0A509AP30_PLABA|nr:conserved protein, unknown function [Plasmodium berghei ANKA]CXI83327.1 conserved Plasmodium protein, unknown function [Plasmodium berghei]SCM25698.1 conserved Plasmodium protein, unknown function [Plasmodium berghei]SCN27457.1 conserved Plasmodium protein, unknown function [Plasmodium berghei]SCO62162.1 conserved Plasmodium protein, unknown function [Plasmodium berghei]SCO63884.1 conserved Plasmodium protein, unknown function [Plasmodium berghei]|eukprot:XP_034423089.1 conserved protein, unknown function [Plasmodium berghei ANKA]
MLRPIYVIFVECFIALSVIYIVKFEQVKCQKDILPFDKIFPKIASYSKKKKIYFFIPNSYSTKINNLFKKNTTLAFRKINNTSIIINNNTVDFFKNNNNSPLFFNLNQFRLFNNTLQNNEKEENQECLNSGLGHISKKKQNDVNLETRQKWKKHLEDKRRKEILKHINNMTKEKSNVNGKNKKKHIINKRNTKQTNYPIENDAHIEKEKKSHQDVEEEDDYYEDEEEDYYEDEEEDYYEDEEDEDEDYEESYEDDEENIFNPDKPNEVHNTKDSKRREENQYCKPHEYNIHSNYTNSPINNNINNAFMPKKKNDFPLFFPTNNKHFEKTNNKYFDKICSIPPNELINLFFENTPERVKEAVKNIIFNIIGNIQKYALDISVLITYDKIYNFLLQILLTGYMLKNADYRLSLNESLYDQNNQNNQKENSNFKKYFNTIFSDNFKKPEELLNSDQLINTQSDNITNYDEEKKHENNTQNENNTIHIPVYEQNKNINTHENNNYLSENDNNNNSKIHHNTKTDIGEEFYTKFKQVTNEDLPIINTKNYIIFLKKKINSLENQLKALKENKTFQNDDLLSYIKSLTDIQLRSLTDNIGTVVLDATKKIVELVIQGMTLNVNKNLPNELIYTSGSVLTYICFWQLIVGYTFREMEIRDELADYFNTH